MSTLDRTAEPPAVFDAARDTWEAREADPAGWEQRVDRVAIALWRCDTGDEFPGVDLERLWPKVVAQFPDDAAAYRRLAAAALTADAAHGVTR